MEQRLHDLAQRVAQRLTEAGLMLCCAESCTGGWVAKVCTDLPGSSKWFERGFVTYTNESKQELLAVPASTLDAFGAVSEPTVEAMARGALDNSRAQLSLAVSGIAGPGGGSEEKPVGTVFHAWALQAGDGVRTRHQRCHYEGDREAVRAQAVARALEGVLELLDGQ